VTDPLPDEVRAALGAEPTAEQWRAISMPLEPYVVVAGAGSGKTSVIAARVVYLALVALGRVPADHAGVLPGNVLCLTFTNKATENLTLRVRRALSVLELPEGEEPAIQNYHGFAAQVLERHGLLAGVEPGQRVLTPAQRSELCARVLDEMRFRHVHAEWQPSLVSKILELADQAANHRVTPERIIAFNEARLDQLKAYRSDSAYQAALERLELAEAVRRFEALKRRVGVIDFGDQITMALQVVEDVPAVAQEYRSRYQAAVLDEYQDTNVAQAELIGGLFGGGYPIMAVGDPDQNIYAWRGASLFNLLQFQDRFRRADGGRAAALPLYTNFRSGSRILEGADAIVGEVHRWMERLPEPFRPDPGKRLVPWEPNGEGEVQVVRHSDEWTEARWIAVAIWDLHARDPEAAPWSSFAVLCRKSRLFAPLQEAFAEMHIPVEIVGLAGLLRLPEVVEILAYARAVADPFASVSLARILLGPRYRVGFKDVARVAAWAKRRNTELRESARELELRDEDDAEPAPFLFAEALEHLDEVEFLSDEGRRRLEECRAELVEMRSEARRPVGEFLAEVVRRIGLGAELDALPDAEQALATRRNLAAFLDEVHAFSPLEGELTLASFLDYVDTVEEGERQEWSPVQPSDQDSVKVMTVHQAKGLEFDTVFVPGVTQGLLPDTTIQHNPAERGKSLDFELRGDHAILPRFDGVLSHFKAELKAQELIEERRTCYVALTRARRRLVVTGAHWYGEEVQKPREAGLFFEELADWGERTGRASVDRGPDPDADNPLTGYRQRFVRDWPGPALRDEGDDLFPGGWRRTAADAAGDPAILTTAVAGLEPKDRQQFEEIAGRQRVLAAHLIQREATGPDRVPAPAMVSVANLVEYALCPKRFYWTAVRPLPRFSGPSARIGTQVHAWIERQGSGQASLIELDQEPDLTAEELAGEPGKVERLQRTFLESRFAGAVPLYTERPFVLYLDGVTIKGRIDAVFGTPEGRWEVVDYKTGRRPPPDDPVAGLQLDVYALACTEVFAKRAQDLTLTYFYLASGDEVSREAGDPGSTRERVAEALRRIARGEFSPTPGAQCRWCDFRPFCQAGQEFLATSDPGGAGVPVDASVESGPSGPSGG
jgi:DNA helicase-2/ATP-dependent DNA helicase PcrA